MLGLRKNIAACAVAMTAVLLAGCAGGSNASGDTIKIGELVALSGSLSSAGVPLDRGITQAIDDANAAGGVNGKKLQLVRQDYQSKPELVVSSARSLIAQKVAAIGGLESGSVATSVDPVAEGAKIPVVTAAGQNPTNQWDFAAFPTTGYFDLMANYAKQRGHTRMCSLVIPGANAETQDQVVYPVFNSVGMPVVKVVEYSLSATDLTPQLTVIRDAGCNALYVAGTGSGVVLAAQAAANLGMRDLLIVTHGGNANAGNTSALKDNTGNVYFAVPKPVVADLLPPNDAQLPAVKPFFDAYQARFHEAPDPDSAIGYVIGETIIAGLKDGHTTGESLRDWLETASVDTVLGTYKRSVKDHNGSNAENYFMMGRWDPVANRFIQ